MNPNIRKLFEEDEDETMHSGADGDAFTAKLNRDIDGGNVSTSHQPSDSNREALSQGIIHTESQFLQQRQTSSHDEDVNFQSGKDILTMEPKDQHPTRLELQQDGSDFKSDTKEDDSTHEFKNDGSPQPQDDQNTLPASRPMGTMTLGKNPVHIQGPDNESYSERESELYKLQSVNSPHSIAMGSNNQVPLAPESNYLQPVSPGKGNQQTSSMKISNGQTMATMNQHALETGLNSQQGTTSGLSNQQSRITSNQQPGTSVKLNKQVPFRMLFPIIQPQLDKDRAMQLQTLYFKLRKYEISKDNFVRHMRSLVGDQMLKMAVYKLQTQAAKNLQTTPNQHQLQPSAGGRQLQGSSSAQMSTDLRNPMADRNTVKSYVVESQVDSQGLQGLDKQQHPHFSQTSGSNYSPFSATNFSSSTSMPPQLHDSQMRLASAHPNITSNHLGPTTQNTNVMNMAKFERPSSFSDPKKMQARTLTQMTSSAELPQNLAEWASTPGVSSSMPYAKQEPVDQSSELQLKTQLNSSQGLSNLSSAQNMMSSLTASIGAGNFKAPLKKPLVGQKKQIAGPGSSPPSSKKQKVAGTFLDQSIEQLNDVTAVSGVNLREEEEQLFSGSKEDSRDSEASRQVQEEEERLILHKIPLQKQVAEIMAKSGLKNMNSDVERCLSLCVEERMRGIIANLIRLSKQRVNMEKLRHKTIVTSDVRQKIMTINRKASEEWEKKQAETEQSQKLIETECDSGIHGEEKDESRTRSVKANKDEDDKMRTTAANVAVRAATGVGDMLSKWQLMIAAKQKLGGTETLSGSQAGKDVARKPLPTSARNTRESQEADKRDRSPALNTTGRMVDLNKLRSREKISGRPLPWSGSKIRGDDREVTRLSLPLTTEGALIACTEDDRGPGNRRTLVPTTSVARHTRAPGAVLDKRRDAGRQNAETGRRKDDQTLTDPQKRYRTDSGFLPKRLCAHPLLREGVNQQENAESFWDLNDFGIGLRKGAKIVSDSDMSHLIPHPSSVLHQSIALNSCQILSCVRALQTQEDKMRADDSRLRKELARLRDDVSRLETSDAIGKEEIRRLELENAGLKDELHTWPKKLEVKDTEGENLRKELSTLYEKHYAEVQTGATFLSSPAGTEFQKSLECKVVENYRASSSFEDEVFQHAFGLHDELVIETRRILRETQRVPEDIVLLIGPSVPDIDESV